MSDARDVISLARALVREDPYDSIERILLESGEVRGLPQGGMGGLEDALAKGTAHVLARHGGWRKIGRRTNGNDVTTARLWELRVPTLRFTPYTFELIRWAVSQPLGGGARLERFRKTPVTLGDELIAYLLLAAVEDKPVEELVASQPGIRASVLAWLGFTRLLGLAEGAHCPFDHVASLAKEPVILEGLEDDLSRRAERFDRQMTLVEAPAKLTLLGETRFRLLDELASACVSADRLELATFLVTSGDAATKLTKTSLDKRAALRERLEARRTSAAHLRVLSRLAKEHEKARATSYIDEGYVTAQLVLARWEHFGNDGFARATAALAQFESWDGG